MRSRVVTIEAPRSVRIREEELEAPAAGELTVAARVSAISAGTELLFYRGDLPEGTPLDDSLSALGGELRYPVVYGYATVGDVVAVGPEVSPAWLGRRVFAFSPHRSHFLVKASETFPLPKGADPERAVLLPTAETAVNLVLDGAPLIGERAIVVGQGVVGLVTSALLARFPLARLWTVDVLEPRRLLSKRLGAMKALHPEELGDDDFDLGFELSGAPEALNTVIGAMAVEGRIVVGSWYGEKRAPIDLGTRFHRRRLRLLSSQVSRIGGKHSPRWSHGRRLELAWERLSDLPVGELVSHRLPLDRATEAYRLLDENPEACLQVLLTYT